MSLSLKKPLVFFDLETTGINIITDRIVSLSLIRLEPNGQETSKTFLINPEIPIPHETTLIHGISDEDVKDAPTFKQLANTISQLFLGADLAGFNSNRFDIPFLAEEFIRAGIDFSTKNRKFIDVQVIFHKKEPRDLSAAYRFYCNKDHTDAHTSEADTRATMEVFMAQLEKYDDLPKDIEELSKFSSHNQNVDLAGHIIYNKDGIEAFNIGKHKGVPVLEVFAKDPGYYGWFCNAQFPEYSKKVLSDLRLKSKMG